jgi:hypothetical protein
VVASWSLGSAGLDRGIERFHDARDASVNREVTSLRVPYGIRTSRTGFTAERVTVGVFFPRVPLTDCTSDTPVASPSSAHLTEAFAAGSGNRKEPPRST